MCLWARLKRLKFETQLNGHRFFFSLIFHIKRMNGARHSFHSLAAFRSISIRFVDKSPNGARENEIRICLISSARFILSIRICHVVSKQTLNFLLATPTDSMRAITMQQREKKASAFHP